jgi:nicotinate-nucleotide adenylyltransferase
LKKIGILGGTLNPIHIGHLIMAQSAKEELGLDKVVFMPSGYPPHKNIKNIVSNEHRSNMIKLSIENNDRFEFSDLELKRDGVIYTVDTLEILKSKFPEDKFFFIMGADSIFNIETWKMPDKIFKYCTIVVADRDNSSSKIKEKIAYLEEKYICDIVFINSPLVNVSSSYIRNNVKNNISIKYLVNEYVEKYIAENNLYRQ